MRYDDQNIFAKILRGDIPNKTIYEDDYALSFHDIGPQAKIHALVIPKGKYLSIQDFGEKASAEEITGFYRAVAKTAEILGLPKDGYRAIANTGENGGQEVPHFHIHLLGGEMIGPMRCK